MLYTATVAERVITLDKTEFHQDAVGVDFVDLSLDSEWEGAEFTIIVFYRGRTSRGTSEICGKRLWYGEPVDVPPEALTEAGDLRLTVLGVWPDGDRIVTCEMEDGGEVCWSGAHDVDWAVEPGEDAIDALVRMVKASTAAAEEAAQSAEEATATAGAVSKRLDLIANSDDETLDQLAEFAEFVKENRDLIENLDPLPQGGSDGQVLTLVEGAAAWAEPQGADWDAEDGEPGYIANRTHWKDLVEVSYLTNKTLTFTKNYGGEPYASLDGMPGIVEGREYTVVWGGTSYTCTAYMPSNSNIHVALGDSASKGDSDASSGTGEPFYITNEIDTDYWTFYRSSVGKVVVSVSCIEPTYHTIDVKYLPFIAASGEGEGSIVLGSLYNVASGEFAFASGGGTNATGGYSSAEGAGTTASGDSSHAEGNRSVADGRVSHAEGFYTRASGLYTHAEGWETLASSNYQHVQGKYNVEDTTKTYAHIVGNGTSSKRSNAHTLDWDGNAWYAGTVLVGGTSQADAAEVATKAYVDDMLGVIENGSY